MKDVEEVINAISRCIRYNELCSGCEYQPEHYNDNCRDDLMEDVICFLNAQEKDINALKKSYKELVNILSDKIVFCKDCKHRPVRTETTIDFPDERCPCQCDDYFYSWYPEDDWFCANGEVKNDLC